MQFVTKILNIKIDLHHIDSPQRWEYQFGSWELVIKIYVERGIVLRNGAVKGSDEERKKERKKGREKERKGRGDEIEIEPRLRFIGKRARTMRESALKEDM